MPKKLLLREEHGLRYFLERCYSIPSGDVWHNVTSSSELKKIQAHRRRLTAQGIKTRILMRATHINWRVYSEHEAS